MSLKNCGNWERLRLRLVLENCQHRGWGFVQQLQKNYNKNCVCCKKLTLCSYSARSFCLLLYITAFRSNQLLISSAVGRDNDVRELCGLKEIYTGGCGLRFPVVTRSAVLKGHCSMSKNTLEWQAKRSEETNKERHRKKQNGESRCQASSVQDRARRHGITASLHAPVYSGRSKGAGRDLWLFPTSNTSEQTHAGNSTSFAS